MAGPVRLVLKYCAVLLLLVVLFRAAQHNSHPTTLPPPPPAPLPRAVASAPPPSPPPAGARDNWHGCIDQLDSKFGKGHCAKTADCASEEAKRGCAKACKLCSMTDEGWEIMENEAATVSRVYPRTFQGTGYLVVFLCPTFSCNDGETNTLLGPNNQFKAFRHAANIAHQLNRTLVIPQFHSHHLDVSSAKGPRWWDFNATFDFGVFRHKVPSVSVQEFFGPKSPLGPNLVLDKVLACASNLKRFRRGIHPLKALQRFKVTSKEVELGTKTTWNHVQQVSADSRFLGMRVDHYGSPVQASKWWCDGLKYIYHAMPRAPPLRTIATKYRKKYLGTDQYIAIHLRLGDYCNEAGGLPFSMCYHLVPWDVLWAKIEEVAKEAGVTRVFVSAPPKIHRLADVKAPAGSPVSLHFLGIQQLKEFGVFINYKAAMVEQEIAVHAKAFMFSGSTEFCLPQHKCSPEQDKTFEKDFNWGALVGLKGYVPGKYCCKNGIRDGRMYGESFGGNIAEERWAHGEQSLNIPELLNATWTVASGARDCTGRGANKLAYKLLEKAQ